jgi:protein SCO1/2
LNSQNTNFRLIIMATFVALLSATAGFSLWQIMRYQQQPSTAALVVLPEPRVIADFALVDQDGNAFTLDDLRGKWSLLFFGFTHCPDVCPSTLYDLQLVHKGVRQDSGNGPPSHQVLFVSVDPERDTPEKLGEYVSYFDPDFIGVTGSQQQLAPLTRQLGIAYRIEEHEAGSAQYGVDHSASILVTDPEGRLHGVFPAPHDAGTIVEDLSTVLD